MCSCAPSNFFSGPYSGFRKGKEGVGGWVKGRNFSQAPSNLTRLSTPPPPCGFSTGHVSTRDVKKREKSRVLPDQKVTIAFERKKEEEGATQLIT
jgi:hypothetical protein